MVKRSIDALGDIRSAGDCAEANHRNDECVFNEVLTLLVGDARLREHKYPKKDVSHAWVPLATLIARYGQRL